MISRRSVLAAPLGLTMCRRPQARASEPRKPFAPLKSFAPFPVGVAGMSGQFEDPRWVELTKANFTQITPEWEMKLESLMPGDGGLDFSRADKVARFATENGLRLHGHALVWYSQTNDFFRERTGRAFEREYDRYVREVTARYRGRAVSWDVVNEPVAEDGNGLRACLWSERLGADGYIQRALETAREADPDAVLFINDYNLENLPAKGATFLKLVERLLKAGAPLGGIGTQSHLDIEIPHGRITNFFREARQFGLPIHVSELDASLTRDGAWDPRPKSMRLGQQQARVQELCEAFLDLPEAQRWAFTVWGVRDTDSWLLRRDEAWEEDSPLLFDGEGNPNAMYDTVARAFGR